MKHLKLGDDAPKFKGIDGNGKMIQLADYSGKHLVVYFYPKDNTPGCTAQACNLRDHFSALTEKNISVVGVSGDDEKSHLRFTEKFELPFPLIADVKNEVIEQFGVWGPKKFMGREYDGVHRTTFIISPEQKIIGIIEKPKTKFHAEEILSLLQL
jgi:peroxiredoxin Q/BCP